MVMSVITRCRCQHEYYEHSLCAHAEVIIDMPTIIHPDASALFSIDISKIVLIMYIVFIIIIITIVIIVVESKRQTSKIITSYSCYEKIIIFIIILIIIAERIKIQGN